MAYAMKIRNKKTVYLAKMLVVRIEISIGYYIVARRAVNCVLSSFHRCFCNVLLNVFVCIRSVHGRVRLVYDYTGFIHKYMSYTEVYLTRQAFIFPHD